MSEQSVTGATSRPRRLVVLGGGVTGLAAAHRALELAREQRVALEVELLEASPRLGGAIWTDRVDAYPVVEGGPDMFITDKPWALALAERLGLGDKLLSTNTMNRRSLVLRDGLPVEVPEGFTLMAPTKVVPMVKTPLLSWAGKARMAADLVLPRRADDPKEDESIASFVRRRFGQEVLDRLVQPLVGGIYTGDPERLSLRATLPRFLEMEREHRSVALAGLKKGRAESSGISGARYGLFVSPKGGMGTFITRLVERVKAGAKVRLSTSAERLEVLAEGHRIHLASGEAIDADAVIVALPAFAAAGLLEGASRRLADELVGISYASTAVVVSGHALADVKHALDAFGLVIPHVERRKILAVSFASRKLADRAPHGSVQLRTFVGGAMQPELYELSDARIEGIVLDELHAILGVDGTPDFVRVMRHHRAMPQYLVGHLERVARIEEATRALPGLALAGSAYRGVGVPDCVRSAELAAEAVALGASASSRRTG